MSTSVANSPIARPNPLAESDPIHEWMRIVPKALPESKRPEDIADELRNGEFDPGLSRAIVFTASRNNTETLATELDALAEDGSGWQGCVGYFHAGMAAEDRTATYERFRKGDIVILCATKAFGMGMDLPNIHYVFHHQPPFSLEDYIQEIGRAGRSDRARGRAGFGPERPIRCILYADPGDFKSLKDRNKSSRLAWDQLSRIQEVIHEYAARLSHHKASPDTAIPIPLNLLGQHSAFRDEWDPSSIQRMGFHWLERLKRIRQAYYVPAHLELENKDPETQRATSDDVRRLCQHVEMVRGQTAPGRDRILVNTGALYNALDINTSAALFDRLRRAQEAEHIRVFRELSVRCTKQRFDLIQKTAVHASLTPPHLKLAFHLARSIGRSLPYDRFLQLDAEWFRDEVENAARDVLAPSKWRWLEDEADREKLRADVIKDLQRSARARAILFLVRNGPNVQFQRELDNNREVFSLRVDASGPKAQTRILRYLERQQDLVERLLPFIYRRQERNERIDLIETLQRFNLDEAGIERFEQALLFLKRMGFIKMSGGLLPMAIETYLLSKSEVDISNEQGDDYKVYQDFQQSGRLKELRLVALQVLAQLRERDEQNQFIRQYLSSRDASEVFSLLEETLSNSEDHQELLRSLRKEALKKEVERLSNDQRSVYDAPLHTSTLVMAGPGSGKTHTLLLRLARLIHEENISPSQILVLAYNRAVVTEIKVRLRELFGKLGYRNLSRSLRVFTFHGLIRYALGDAVDVDDLHKEGDQWVEKFNRATKERPGHVATQLSPDSIRYIFVDEFQDITEKRYQMLRWIAQDNSRVTAIGDPDQSIYGYERAQAGQSRSSEPYFKRFASDFDAQSYTISDNFRSLPKIVEAADSFIERNKNRISRNRLEPRRDCPDDWEHSTNYVEVHAHKRHAWLDRLRDLLTEQGPEGYRHRDVAVLFRSNAEVYRAYRLVHEHLDGLLKHENIPVVLQGATHNWTRVREVAYCLDRIEALASQTEEEDLFPIRASLWERYIRPKGGDFPECWDNHTLNLVRSLIQRFKEEQSDDFSLHRLTDYIHEVLRQDKGQIYKLIQIHQEQHEGRASRTPTLVLANLHKVKGLEYDAVLLPASFQPLPFPAPEGRVSAEEMTDMIDEERRVYYVGMTRARDRLIRYEWKREQHLKQGTPYDKNGDKIARVGLAFNADAYSGRVMISKCANKKFVTQKCRFDSERGYLKYIALEVHQADPVEIQRESDRWFVVHGGNILAELSKTSPPSKKSPVERIKDYFRDQGVRITNVQRMTGLTVSNVTRYTYEDSVQYDEKNSTKYTEQWSSYFIKRGYTYIVNFAGYAQVA